MANVTTYINKIVVPNGSNTITANLVDTVSGYITDAGVTSVNGRTGDVTVTEGLAPLIGTTSTVTATEVKTAVEEGRDVCISYTHSTYGVLKFTSFNVANSMHSVVSQAIVNYNGTILCFELIGVMLSEDTQERWLCTVDTLASSSDIPTKTSDLTNDSGYTTNTGTVTQIAAGAGLNTTSSDTSTDGGNITASGTLYLTKSGVTAGTYHGLTVDKYGRITAANANTKFVTAVGLEKDVATFATGSGTTSTTNTDWLKGLSVSGTTLVVGAATLNTDSGLTADTLIVYTDEDESNLPAANGVGF